MKSDGRMNDCGRIAALLPGLLDGDLDGDAKRTAEAHLRGCATCAAERDALARTLTLVAERPRSEPGEAFFASMRREVGRQLAEPAPSRSRPLVLRPAWQSGFAAAAMLVALLIWRPWQGDGGDYLARLESAGRQSLEQLGTSSVVPASLLMEEAPEQLSEMIDELDDEQLDRFLSALEAMKG